MHPSRNNPLDQRTWSTLDSGRNLDLAVMVAAHLADPQMVEHNQRETPVVEHERSHQQAARFPHRLSDQPFRRH